MGIIINPRGIGGSGKTELVRRLMRDYGWAPDGLGESARVEKLFRPGRNQPIGYAFAHPLDRRPLVVLGQYERTSGGCDTIPLKDGGLGEIFRLAADHVSGGFDVVIEGLQISKEWETSAELAQSHPLHVLHLDTAPEISARNLARRRRLGKDKTSIILNRALSEREVVMQACERLRGHAEVHHLSFDGALGKARELLRLA